MHALVLVILPAELEPEWEERDGNSQEDPEDPAVGGMVDQAMGPYRESNRIEFMPIISDQEELEREHAKWVRERGPYNRGCEVWRDPLRWADEQMGYSFDPQSERWGLWHNPQGKWDYYDIGGRWEDELQLKEGGTASFARMRDIDPDYLSAFFSFAVLNLAEGIWHDREDLDLCAGGFPNSDPEKELWMERASSFIEVKKLADAFSRHSNPSGLRYISELLKDAYTLYEKQGVWVRDKDRSGTWYSRNEREHAVSHSCHLAWWIFSNFIKDQVWHKHYHPYFLGGLDPDNWLVLVDYHC